MKCVHCMSSQYFMHHQSRARALLQKSMATLSAGIQRTGRAERERVIYVETTRLAVRVRVHSGATHSAMHNAKYRTHTCL